MSCESGRQRDLQVFSRACACRTRRIEVPGSHPGRTSFLKRGQLGSCVAWLGASSAREPLGLAAGRAALHVDDLAVTEREHLKALLPRAGLVHPQRGADDHVVADSGEFGLHVDSPGAAFVDLEGQDLTGLVGPVSGRRPLPPQMATGDAAPFALVGDQLGERSRVASVEGIRRRPELVDHDRIMPPARWVHSSAFAAGHRLGQVSQPATVELWLVPLQPVKLRAPPLGVAFSLFALEPFDVVDDCVDGRRDDLAAGV